MWLHRAADRRHLDWLDRGALDPLNCRVAKDCSRLRHLNDDGNTDLATASDLLFNQLPAMIGMGVQPLDDFVSIGPYGGPFEPSSKTYTLTNNEDFPIEYSAGADADWITIDNTGGMIPAGGSVDVTVSINQNAESLPHGDYDATVSLVNLTNHHGDRTRDVTLQIGIPQVIYSFLLDTDPGWQTEGQWAFGQPTGQGGAHGSPDPTSGYTGPNVYGYNLNGDYPGGLWYTSLTTDAIDCSNLSHVTLRFRRWLGVRDQPDNAYIRLSTDGAFFLYVWVQRGRGLRRRLAACGVRHLRLRRRRVDRVPPVDHGSDLHRRRLRMGHRRRRDPSRRAWRAAARRSGRRRRSRYR